MKFTDIFIRRPVLATVVSLLILVLGLRSAFTLSVSQYPHTENAQVIITTAYYGADPATIAGFITTPMENAIAQANGIDYMTSLSYSGLSTINVFLRLNYNANDALTEINTKISSVLNQLPSGTQQPVLTVQIGAPVDAMYLGFSSKAMALNQITDYVVRVVQPKLQSVTGVQTAEILGGKNYALRAWLDPTRLAAYGLTAVDVSQALAANNYIAGLGMTKGQMVQVNLTASTSLHSLKEFENLVIKQQNGAIVRLKDVATVTIGNDDYEIQNNLSGTDAVFVGIKIAPSANLLDVLKDVRKQYDELIPQMPQGLETTIGYDSSDFVNSAIAEVESTLIEAALIVTLVVFLFLGSLRSVLIPAVAIPLSLIGTAVFMLAFGFSINLLTLLALVLAIGLVVDDAIIVVENVNRHLEDGLKPVQAALRAARELGGPIVAMAAVLVAVYVPIGFQPGLTGALFTEFAFTLVGAVVVSAVVALTLSPMMSSRLLKAHSEGGDGWQDRLTHFIDQKFEWLRHRYGRALHGSLNTLPVTVVFAAIMLGSIFFLYSASKSELAPEEDQGIILTLSNAASNSTLQQRQIYAKQVFDKMSSFPETNLVFQILLPGPFMSGLVMKPWDQRSRTTTQVQPLMQAEMDKVTGAMSVAFQPSPLPGAIGLPLQFVINTSNSFEQLDGVAKNFLGEALKSGMFIFLDTDLKIDQPESNIEIDRDKAAQLGLKMSDIGTALGSMLGGGYVNYFSLDGRSYKVIPQVQQQFRLNLDQLLNYYIRTPDGTPIPLSTVAHITTRTVPQSLNHFQQLNGATIMGVTMPGVTLGDAITYLSDLSKRTLPVGYTIDYGGMTRQFIQEQSGFAALFGFALVVVFLVLAALFESFRDPLIILLSVPMSIAGALIFIALGFGGASLNIYTQVGLVTLMGLISKHGILIVQFANDLQREGKSKREAIESAATIRLRPILMTTAAMVLGVIPLLVATGAGAASRFHMGLVIASGISIGTLFTLFVVPAAYILIAANHTKEEKLAQTGQLAAAE